MKIKTYYLNDLYLKNKLSKNLVKFTIGRRKIGGNKYSSTIDTYNNHNGRLLNKSRTTKVPKETKTESREIGITQTDT